MLLCTMPGPTIYSLHVLILHLVLNNSTQFLCVTHCYTNFLDVEWKVLETLCAWKWQNRFSSNSVSKSILYPFFHVAFFLFSSWDFIFSVGFGTSLEWEKPILKHSPTFCNFEAYHYSMRNCLWNPDLGH